MLCISYQSSSRTEVSQQACTDNRRIGPGRPHIDHFAAMIRLQLTSALSVLLLALTASAQDSRVAKFSAIAAKNGGVIPLNNQLYDELVGHGSAASSPRNYTASIILTALPAQFGCKPCRDFDKVHSELAKQWRVKSKKTKTADSTHFFAVLDFPNGQDVFRRVGRRVSRSFNRR